MTRLEKAKELKLKVPQECYENYGRDLDSCSRQENGGCKACPCLEPYEEGEKK